jgi:spermidine synthase
LLGRSPCGGSGGVRKALWTFHQDSPREYCQAVPSLDPSPLASAPRSPDPRLLLTFFVSGFPALVYQLVWQRALFALYGVNVEAITVVVAAFMLGLGLGSLLGGWLSLRARVRPVLLFAAFELVIGAFGLQSLHLFQWVGERTLGADTLHTGLLTFVLVLVPTCLMGATMPLLVKHLVESQKNVGQSLGTLYFVNTLGSAVACFAAAWILLPQLGMQGSVNAAALLNLLVAGAAASLAKPRSPNTLDDPSKDDAAKLAAPNHTPASTPELDVARPLPLRAGLWLSGLGGFIALSHEILWSRVFGFASGGSAYAFPLLLGSYLVGIAFGSSAAGRYCRRSNPSSTRSGLAALATLTLAANALAFWVTPLVSLITPHAHYVWALPLLALAASALGALFPLLGHLCVQANAKSGARVSYLYVANIIGSTLGSLLTGFVLMDLMSLGSISFCLASLGCGLALWIARQASPNRSPKLQALPRPNARQLIWGSGLIVLLLGGRQAYAGLYERLLPPSVDRHDANAFTSVVENKHGVVAVQDDGTVYGGGVYDGIYSVDLVNDRNMLIRPFALGAFHAQPRQVLTIGLASGSWAQVLISHPNVERLTVVEINPGYLGLMGAHPAVSPLLDNPKLELVIDDGRRWLAAHPERKFDAIVMNTTFHWRAHSTNLLSQEFLRAIGAHLNAHGIALINTTGSDSVYQTAVRTFPFAYRFFNTVVVGNETFHPDRSRWQQLLENYRIDGRSVFDLPSDQGALDRALSTLDREGPPEEARLESHESLLARTKDAPIVTDDNMATEWHHLQ